MKTVKQILGVGLVSIFLIGNAFAATANLKFYTSETSPKTGGIVELDLKVDGNTKTPYYTYVVNMEYDKDKLKLEGVTYGDGWVGVEPEAKTDIEKGIVKRTAGYPNGATKLMTVLKYKFKALAPGKAEVKITGEAALDQENKSADLQKKNITLNISGKELTEEIAALKNQNITLNIVAENSFAADATYPIKVEHVLTNPKETVGTTSVYVMDINGEKVMNEDRAFNISQNTSLDFSIPANALVAGNYNIVTESIFLGQTESNKQVKEVVVTAGSGNVDAVAAGASDNVFVNIWNAIWKFITENIIAIVGVLFILILLKFISSKFRRYRRRDGR